MSPDAPFLTVFTIPKPFTGLTAVHQNNAIHSWVRLGPEVDVILCGDEMGVAEAARQFGAQCAPNISRNSYGTPLVSAAMAAATAGSRAKFHCYVNADIILMSDFLSALKSVQLTTFVLCGRRWDVQLDQLLDFEAVGWEDDLRRLVRARGTLHAPEAMDYFAFPRGFVGEMPPFAVGRALWDNWFIFNARARGAAVVDATADTCVVHQEHDYAHLPGGQLGAWHGPEAVANRRLALQMLYPFTIADATLLLKNGKLVRQAGALGLLRSRQSALALAVREHPAVIRLIRTALRAKDPQA